MSSRYSSDFSNPEKPVSEEDEEVFCSNGFEKLTAWWEGVWSIEGKAGELGFDRLFEMEEVLPRQLSHKYIEPDAVRAPNVILNTAPNRPPSPKFLLSRPGSDCTDYDFDWGSAISQNIEEMAAAHTSDNESLFETSAISLETCLQSIKTLTIKKLDSKDRAAIYRKTRDSSVSTTGSEAENSNGAPNTNSMHESLERNWEYYENLRRCYDPNPNNISPSPSDRARSEGPNLLEKLKISKSPIAGSRIIRLKRRESSPAFVLKYFPKTKLTPPGSRMLILRRSQSSHEFANLPRNRLYSLKEQDDELKLAYEPIPATPRRGAAARFHPDDVVIIENSKESPSETLLKMKGIIKKGMIVGKVINDIKREVIFKEAKDEVHDLPEESAFQARRLTSPEPTNNVQNGKKMSYKELNRMGLLNQQFSSVSPILSKKANKEEKVKAKVPESRIYVNSTGGRRGRPKSRPIARLHPTSRGYMMSVHKSTFQMRLDEKLEDDLANIIDTSSSEDDDNVPTDETPDIESDSGLDVKAGTKAKKPVVNRFDSSACMIVPNEFRISPSKTGTGTANSLSSMDEDDIKRFYERVSAATSPNSAVSSNSPGKSHFRPNGKDGEKSKNPAKSKRLFARSTTFDYSSDED